jgi:hypothetical protein
MGILGEQTAPDPSVATPAPTMNIPNTTSDSNSGGGLIGGAINAITGGAIGHIVSGLFAGSEDQRQYNQAAKLQGLQLQGAETIGGFNEAQQEKYWNDTNAEAQVQHLQNAGLNPALMYAKGGAGGSTIGAPAQMPTSATPTDPSARDQAATGMAMMMMQQKVMQSQADLNEAQAQKLKTVDTTNTQADTTLKGTQTESLTQGIENQKAQLALTNAQTDLTNIQNEIQGKTIDDQIETIAQTANSSQAQAESAMIQANIDQNTKDTKMNMIQQMYQNAMIDAALKTAQTQNTNAQTTVEQFKAGLAKAGISPDAPWYVKMVGDLMQKLGINPITKAEGQ